MLLDHLAALQIVHRHMVPAVGADQNGISIINCLQGAKLVTRALTLGHILQDNRILGLQVVQYQVYVVDTSDKSHQRFAGHLVIALQGHEAITELQCALIAHNVLGSDLLLGNVIFQQAPLIITHHIDLAVHFRRDRAVKAGSQAGDIGDELHFFTANIDGDGAHRCLCRAAKEQITNQCDLVQISIAVHRIENVHIVYDCIGAQIEFYDLVYFLTITILVAFDLEVEIAVLIDHAALAGTVRVRFLTGGAQQTAQLAELAGVGVVLTQISNRVCTKVQIALAVAHQRVSIKAVGDLSEKALFLDQNHLTGFGLGVIPVQAAGCAGNSYNMVFIDVNRAGCAEAVAHTVNNLTGIQIVNIHHAAVEEQVDIILSIDLIAGSKQAVDGCNCILSRYLAGDGINGDVDLLASFSIDCRNDHGYDQAECQKQRG